MVKSFLFTSIATLFGAILVTQSEAPAVVKNHVATLNGAKSFKAELTLRKVTGGAAEKEAVSYSKEGMFRIESASTLTVSDGKTLWTLNKSANTYTEGPASLVRTKETDVLAWAAFFNAEVFKGAKEFAVKGSRNLPGGAATEVAVKLANDKEVSLYIDAKTGVAKGLSNSEWIVIAPTMTLGKEVADGKEFTFVPPAGAKKVENRPPTVAFADVQAILKNSCQGCHNDGNPKAGLSVDSYAGIVKTVTAGDAANSRLYRSISGPRPKMPKGGAPLSQKDQETIAGWINSGAKNE